MAADQVDLPQYLEDRQTFDLPWKGWRALPPVEVMGNLPGGALGLGEGAALEGRRGNRAAAAEN